MNRVDMLKIEDTKTKESIDALENGIRIERNLEVEYEHSSRIYEIKNSNHIVDTEYLQPTVIAFTARVDFENDYRFKRFINRKGALFKVSLTVNQVNYYIYCKKGDQVSQLDYGAIKLYEFELLCTTRFLQDYSFTANVGRSAKYGVDRYGDGRYELPVALNTLLVTYSNNGDTSAYIELTGEGTGDEFKLQTGVYMPNGSRHTITLKENIPLGSTFYYSNVPGLFDIKIDERERKDLLLPQHINFEYEIGHGSGTMFVTGLKNIELKLVKGFNIV